MGSDIYMDMMNEDNLTATLAREISMKNYDYNWKDRVLHAINYSASIGDTEAVMRIVEYNEVSGDDNSVGKKDVDAIIKHLVDRGFKATTDKTFLFPADFLTINW